MIVLTIVAAHIILGIWGHSIIRGGKDKTTLFEIMSFLFAMGCYWLFVIWAVVTSIVGLIA